MSIDNDYVLGLESQAAADEFMRSLHPKWHQQALCHPDSPIPAHLRPRSWFPTRTDPKSDNSLRAAICGWCPVAKRCGAEADALAVEDEYLDSGWRAGRSESQRRKQRRAVQALNGPHVSAPSTGRVHDAVNDPSEAAPSLSRLDADWPPAPGGGPYTSTGTAAPVPPASSACGSRTARYSDPTGGLRVVGEGSGDVEGS